MKDNLVTKFSVNIIPLAYDGLIDLKEESRPSISTASPTPSPN